MKFSIYNLSCKAGSRSAGQFSINFKFSNFQKLLKISLLNTLFLFLFTNLSSVNAQVVINEFLPNHSSGEDWIELYSPVDIDISGWVLDDDNTSTDMATISSVTAIGPSTSLFYTVDVGTRLNKDKDIISLYSPNKGNLVDSYSYSEDPGVDVSYGRFPDGQAWGICTPTKNLANTSCSFPTPIPTPTPTLANTPTPKPTATSTPIPTPTKTPTPTKIPTSTKTPTPTKTTLSAGGSEDNPQVLSGQEGSELSLASTPQVLSFETNTDSTQSSAESPGKTGGVPATALLMIAGGVVFLGGGALSIVRRRKSPYNEIDGEKFG